MSDKNTICLDRLKKLIDTTTREEIAQALNCDTSLITKHYNGDRNITLDYAVKYAKHFNISLDYLVGITDTPTLDKDIRFICDYTGLSDKAVENLHKELKKDGVAVFDCYFYRSANSTINFFLENYLSSLFGEVYAYKEWVDFSIKSQKSDNKTAIEETEILIDHADVYRYRAVKVFENALDKYVPEREDYDNGSRLHWEMINNEIAKKYEESGNNGND